MLSWNWNIFVAQVYIAQALLELVMIIHNIWLSIIFLPSVRLCFFLCKCFTYLSDYEHRNCPKTLPRPLAYINRTTLNRSFISSGCVELSAYYSSIHLLLIPECLVLAVISIQHLVLKCSSAENSNMCNWPVKSTLSNLVLSNILQDSLILDTHLLVGMSLNICPKKKDDGEIR